MTYKSAQSFFLPPIDMYFSTHINMLNKHVKYILVRNKFVRLGLSGISRIVRG
jgi:hypothetical protein